MQLSQTVVEEFHDQISVKPALDLTSPNVGDDMLEVSDILLM